MYRIIFSFLLMVSSSLGYSQNLPDFPFVVSVGKAEREVKPDKATVSLGIMSFEKKSDISLDKVGAATDSVLKVLQSYGISSEFIEATDIEKVQKEKATPSITVWKYLVTKYLDLSL